MKKVAVLGDVGSIWIRSFVHHVLAENQDNQIIVISDKLGKGNEFANCNNVIVEYCVPERLFQILRLSALSYYLKVLAIARKYKEFECFHVHYINKRKLFATYGIRKYTKHLILTYWGSDLLRQNPKEHHKMLRFLSVADVITVGSLGMEKYFREIFPEDLCQKLMLVRFGVNGIDAIDQVVEKNFPTREIWKIPKECVAVTIGYNGAREQNHIAVLSEIKKLKKDIQKRLFIILPMTYGLSSDYQKDVEKMVMEIGCQYIILTDYMEAVPTAQLRLATDIFIHAQKTDALSASMQEYLYARKLVMNPIWLKYNELKERDVLYWEYGSFEEVNALIEQFVEVGLNEIDNEKLSINSKIIHEYSSWNSLKNAWREIYIKYNVNF